MHPRQHALSHPAKPAVIMAGSGETIDYATLEADANRFAHWLRAQGVKTGDVVGFQLVNTVPVYVLLWGAQRAGVHYLLVPTGLTTGELDYMVRDSGATLLVRSPSSIAKSSDWEAPEGVAQFTQQQVLDAMADLPSDSIADEAPGQDMMYSSGTTGRPKGIKGPIPAALDSPSRAERIGGSHFGYHRDMVYLVPAPLYHAAPLRWSLAALRHGGTVILMEKFDAEQALALIDRYRIDVIQFVPTHLARLLALPAEVKAKYDVSSLKSIFHAGAPCPVGVKHAMIEWVGPIVHEFYSGTEGIGTCVIRAEEWLERPGSVGRALDGELRICGPDGEPVPVGAEGAVRFANANPFAYHNDPEKTAASYNQHGWPTLGDVGRVDAAGYLFLTDRADFMIISGGVNVYPQEVEDALVAHPDVADAAVIGLPDDDLGQRVTAIVEPAVWPVDEDALTAVLEAHTAATLAPPKRPRAWLFRASLERSETGKLPKKQLRAELLAVQEAAVA